MPTRRRSETGEKPLNGVIQGGIVETPNVMARGIAARAGSPVKTRVRSFSRAASGRADAASFRASSRRASAAPSSPKSTSMPASSQAANTCRGVHFPPGFAAGSDAADLSFFASFSSIFASGVLE